jgi:hypothetical protein
MNLYKIKVLSEKELKVESNTKIKINNYNNHIIEIIEIIESMGLLCAKCM